jgi:hypothetical protein
VLAVSNVNVIASFRPSALSSSSGDPISRLQLDNNSVAQESELKLGSINDRGF